MHSAPIEKISPASRRRQALAALPALAYRYRVYLLGLVIFAVMAIIAPKFRTPLNVSNILWSASKYMLPAVGFTIVLICAQLDLSIGSAMTMGAMMLIGFQPQLGWAGALAVAALCGLVLGLVNGLLVAKIKINSFIVTLGTMIIVKNAMIIYAGGDTPSVGVNELSRWIQAPILWVIPPQVIIPLLLMGVMAVFLSRTPVGKSFYLLGGNAQTAWYAGLNVDRYVIGAFVLSGVLSALGGALIAMRDAAASPTMGDSALMAVVAAVIIGGTSMKGGKGSVFDSAVALVVLAALINGLNCLSAGFHIELMASGLVLASVVLYDAWSLYRREKKRGQRQDLLKELREADAAGRMSSA